MVRGTGNNIVLIARQALIDLGHLRPMRRLAALQFMMWLLQFIVNRTRLTV